MLPLAHIAVGEWTGLLVALGGCLASGWRLTRRIVKAIELAQAAIVTNTEANAMLQRQGSALRSQVEVLSSNLRELARRTERIERLGSTPIREARDAIRDEVVPKLDQLKNGHDGEGER